MLTTTENKLIYFLRGMIKTSTRESRIESGADLLSQMIEFSQVCSLDETQSLTASLLRHKMYSRDC